MAPRKRSASIAKLPSADMDGPEPSLRRSTRKRTAPSAQDALPSEQTTRDSKRPTAKSANKGNSLLEKSDVAKKRRVTKAAKSGNVAADDDAAAAATAISTAAAASTDSFTPFEIPSTSGKKPTMGSRSTSPYSRGMLIFTHGAGGDLSAAAMVNFSRGFVSASISFSENGDGDARTGTGLGMAMFEGNMNLKSRAAGFDIVKRFLTEEGHLNADIAGRGGEGRLVYGGRSMGARAAVVASQSDTSVTALVLASYPLVGPGGDVRDKILLDISEDVDVLFISGDGDSMCDLKMLGDVRKKMKARTWLVKVQGADHGTNIKGGKKLKEGTERVGEMTGALARTWILERDTEKREMDVSWDGEKGEVKCSGWKT